MRAATDCRDLTAFGEPLVCLLSGRDRGGAARRIWLRVALAAGAGLVSLVVCSGALVAIFLLLLYSTPWSFMGSSSPPSPIFWVGLVILIIVATSSLSLPARALGATKDHVTNTAVLSGLGFCAFVFFVFVSLLVTPLRLPSRCWRWSRPRS